MPWGERSFYLTDPWNNPLCIVEDDSKFTPGRMPWRGAADQANQGPAAREKQLSNRRTRRQGGRRWPTVS